MQITGCQAGTATRRIPKWTKRIKGGLLLEVNNIPINNAIQAQQLMNKAVQHGEDTITIKVSPVERPTIHQDEGVPMLYFDQLVTIADHLHDIKYDTQTSTESSIEKLAKSPNLQDTYVGKIVKAYNTTGCIKTLKSILPKNKRRSKKLTRRLLKTRNDWAEWQASEWKQLDDYCNQKTFGSPCILPVGANVLDLLWTYTEKDAVGEIMPDRKKS